MRSMARAGGLLLLTLAASTASSELLAQARDAASQQQVKRGQYLVNYGGCNDCHTPKSMTPKGPVLDESLLLSGHRAGAPVPAVPAGVLGPTQWGALTNGDLTAWAGPWGISFAANLTPDKATGLGAWTYAQFSQTMRQGKHLGTGRDLLPPMPWMSVATLNEADMRALFAYLRSIKAIANRVPAPIPPK
jgi:mono/diheme cytochrome c family protein